MKLKQFNPDSPEFFNPASERGFLVAAKDKDGDRAVRNASGHRLVKARKSATRPELRDLAARIQESQPVSFALNGGWERFEQCQAITRESKLNLISHETAAEFKKENPDPWLALEKFDEQRENVGGFNWNDRPEKLTAEEIENRKKAIAKTDTLKDNQRGAGRYAIIESRKWAGEYRVRTQVDQLAALPTPDTSGERKTKELTLRGARAIADSCDFMAKCHGGYKTFLTLTLDDDARARVASGEMTIQKEVKRFFDGANQVFKRGFTYQNDKGESVKVEPYHGAPDNWQDDSGKMQSLPYCWVIEVPKNANGEDNPHLHVLLGWRIAYRHFDAWAKRLEKLWGQGFAHLEKIKEAEHAGAYMAKAAGYLTKAEGQSDQGEVKGNRYWISKPSRAESWECEGRYQMGEMGGLIRDVYRFMQWKYGHIFKQRAELSSQAAQIRKDAKASKPTPEAKRKAIGNALAKTRKFINELPARATKYSLILKGDGALGSFLNWSAKPYSADHVPKRLHKDGELKAYWLPVCFGLRRGWKADPIPETTYFKQLKQRREQRHEREHRNTEAKRNGRRQFEFFSKGGGVDGAFA